MARSFNGTSSRIYVSSAVLSATPHTIACRFRTTNMTQVAALLTLSSSSSNYSTLFFRGDVAGDPIDVLIHADAGQHVARSTTGCPPGPGPQAGGVLTAPTPRTVYLAGGSRATTTTATSPSPNQTEIGAWRSSSWFSGDIADVGFWNAALTEAEIASLAKGVTPALVRPQSHVSCPPLIRDVIDPRAATAFTEVNTSVAAHPRIYL